MGMASGDLAGARSRQKAGQEAMMDGIKDVANSGMDYLGNTGQLPEGSMYDKNVRSSDITPK